MKPIKTFTFEIQANDSSAIISAHDVINDGFEIPLEQLKGFDTAILDLDDVDWINSEGIRRFIKWLWEVEDKLSGLKISVVKLQPIVVRQLNLIRSQFSKNMQIESVYVPYYCDSCDLDDKSLLVGRQEIQALPADESLKKEVKCPSCGESMEMDVVDDYFAMMR